MRAHTILRTSRWAVLAIVVVVAGTSVVLLGQLHRTAQDLRQARAAVTLGLDALEGGDPQNGIEHLEQAREPLRRAGDRQGGLLWSVAGRAPIAAPSVRTIEALVDAATAGVEAAVALGEAAGATLTSADSDDRVPLRALERLAEVLEGPEVGRLAATHARLAQPVARPVPGVLLDARAEVLEAGDELLHVVPSLRDTVTVLRDLLGADGPRQYLVAMQNSAELRGTGGLVGFHAVLSADRGRLSMSPPRSDEQLDVPAGEVPILDADHRDWIGHARPATSLKTVNLDPDFTRTGPLLARVHEAGTGLRVDGVIAVDPVALTALLDPDDHLVVSTALVGATDGLPTRVAPQDLSRTMLVDAYQVLGGSTDRRKAFHAALAEAAFDELADLTWDRELLDRLGFAVEGRHLQVYSRDAEVQRAVRRLDLAGALAPSVPGADLLAVTVNNAGGGKPDVHVRHDIAARVVVSPPTEGRTGSGTPPDGVVVARREATVGFTLANPLAPDDGWADYISRTSLPGQGPVEALRATNRSWLSVWGPSGTHVRSGRSTDGPLEAAVGTAGGLRVVDHLLSTPPRATRGVELDLDGEVQLRVTPRGLLYRLTLWHQAKAIADHVRVEVRGAGGWEVVAGQVEGRSDADALGFAETAVPLRLSVVDGHATIVGTAVGDVDVELLLRPRGE